MLEKESDLMKAEQLTTFMTLINANREAVKESPVIVKKIYERGLADAVALVMQAHSSSSGRNIKERTYKSLLVKIDKLNETPPFNPKDKREIYAKALEDVKTALFKVYIEQKRVKK